LPETGRWFAIGVAPVGPWVARSENGNAFVFRLAILANPSLLSFPPLRNTSHTVKTTFLDFEQPIAELEQKIEELRFVQDDSAVDISQEIERLSKKSRELTKDIYGKLTAWQISKVARHPQRPYTLDYIAAMCTDFEEIHGDRSFSDDAAIVGASRASTARA